ncbi:aminoacyl-tRNA hydrolase [Cytobacillus sp. IB215316]|uniref:aminoacyl-tRNA hydrolase n=1 Tax=Cytobacillus sp. IB215316 TaxID=3097354 RepID=UPI002A0DC184|nr:aminoacyl-tRNA hydrolase [Cytobacillus sp. IB215316]MDX8363137.1 aminoacyl-tRNA hydrolase [Cytobacillus sp. IB215316]
MKLIVGLGNPGREYALTKHNVGFMVIDQLSTRFNIDIDKSKFSGLYGTGMYNGEKVILCKPLTYMNLSGECIGPLMDYFDIPIEDLLIIYDDLDLPTGKIRLRTKGSAGGHNGIKSTVNHLGTQEFKRVRIGIGRPTNGMAIPNYVLTKFVDDEIEKINDAIKVSTDVCEDWISSPFLQVMNKYN